jgi:hypothetical protein
MTDLYSHIDTIYGNGHSHYSLVDGFHAIGQPPALPHFGSNDNQMQMHMDSNLPRYLDTATSASPLGLVTPTDSSDTSSSHPLLPDSPDPLEPSPSHPRKSRRDRTRIDLAPDQPPTTQGRPRARVFVACVQWCALLFTLMPSPKVIQPCLPVAVARSVAMVRNRRVTTAPNVKETQSAPMILYQNVGDPIGSRVLVLVD